MQTETEAACMKTVISWQKKKQRLDLNKWLWNVLMHPVSLHTGSLPPNSLRLQTGRGCLVRRKPWRNDFTPNDKNIQTLYKYSYNTLKGLSVRYLECVFTGNAGLTNTKLSSCWTVVRFLGKESSIYTTGFSDSQSYTLSHTGTVLHRWNKAHYCVSSFHTLSFSIIIHSLAPFLFNLLLLVVSRAAQRTLHNNNGKRTGRNSCTCYSPVYTLLSTRPAWLCNGGG